MGIVDKGDAFFENKTITADFGNNAADSFPLDLSVDGLGNELGSGEPMVVAIKLLSSTTSWTSGGILIFSLQQDTANGAAATGWLAVPGAQAVFSGANPDPQTKYMAIPVGVSLERYIRVVWDENPAAVDGVFSAYLIPQSFQEVDKAFNKNYAV